MKREQYKNILALEKISSLLKLYFSFCSQIYIFRATLYLLMNVKVECELYTVHFAPSTSMSLSEVLSSVFRWFRQIWLAVTCLKNICSNSQNVFLSQS